LIVCVALALLAACGDRARVPGPDDADSAVDVPGDDGGGSSDELCTNLLYDTPIKLRCCPDAVPPDCSTKPDGYPGYFCTPPCETHPDAGWSCSQRGGVVGSYCECTCQGGSWQCGC